MVRRFFGGRLWNPRTAVFAGIFLVWFVTFVTFVPPGSDGPRQKPYPELLARGDGYYIYMLTLSLALDGDLDQSNQFAQFGDKWNLGGRTTPGGRHYSFPLGTALLQVPSFQVARALATVANLFGADIPTDGYSMWHQRITFFPALLAGFFALLVAYRMAARHYGEVPALLGTALVGLGTNIYFYSSLCGSYAHAWTALAVALLVEYWDRTRGRYDFCRFAWLGGFAGLAALTRMQSIILVAAIPGIEIALEFVRRARSRDARELALLASGVLLASATCILVASPQLIHTHLFYGSPLAVPWGPTFMRWSAPFFWETLFSTNNGLFVWTPLTYLAVIAIALDLRSERRALVAILLFGFTLQVWVNGSAWDYWSSWSFSHRRFDGATILFVLGIASLIARLQALFRRYPKLALQLLVVLLVAPYLLLQLELSNSVARYQQPAGYAIRGDRLYVDSLGRLLGRVHSLVGNPTSWPHNWLWALKHRVSPDRYDLVVGAEVDYFGHDFQKGTIILRPFDMTPEFLRRFATGKWEPFRHDDVFYGAAHDGARLLLPVLETEGLTWRIELSPAPNSATVSIAMNGSEPVVLSPPAGGGLLELPLPAGALVLGTNELTFSCAQGTACVYVRKIVLERHRGSKQPNNRR